MSFKAQQEKIVKRVRETIAEALEIKASKKLTEDDITNCAKVITALTSKGLWTMCGGAWCSAGVPVFDKMSECGSYPLFKHYDVDGNDVTSLANLDCQTPYYFVHLENGSFNTPVIKKFLEHLSV